MNPRPPAGPDPRPGGGPAPAPLAHVDVFTKSQGHRRWRELRAERDSIARVYIESELAGWPLGTDSRDYYLRQYQQTCAAIRTIDARIAELHKGIA